MPIIKWLKKMMSIWQFTQKKTADFYHGKRRNGLKRKDGKQNNKRTLITEKTAIAGLKNIFCVFRVFRGKKNYCFLLFLRFSLFRFSAVENLDNPIFLFRG
jgi:hypothetical protein